MGNKTALGLAGLVLAGAAVSGCQSSRPQTGGPMMSGVPMMSGAANQPNTNATGVAQSPTGQFQNWNNRNAQTGMQTGTTVPAGGTGYPAYNSGAQSYGTTDRSYQTPTTSGSPQSYNRSGMTPSYGGGATTGYPRTTTNSNDRMLTTPTAPSYQPSTSGSTTNGSSITSGMTKPAATNSMPPAPAPVPSTSFGTPPSPTGTSSGATFTPQGEPSGVPTTGGLPPNGNLNQ